nr:immunoglobulin heavy chain junction region [Mus musculus]
SITVQEGRGTIVTPL